MTPYRTHTKLQIWCVGFLLACCSVVVLAQSGAPSGGESQEVGRLLKAGQLEQALQRIDAFLNDKPKDAQMRFFKGLILAEQNKVTEAVQVFTRLTQDYPELPEPYNNLAVLYAAQGQYEKAREALENAILTHPSYATAHENLGDVYAKLASQAYDKALQLDANNSGAQIKLSLARELIGSGRPETLTAVTPAKAATATRNAAAPVVVMPPLVVPTTVASVPPPPVAPAAVVVAPSVAPVSVAPVSVPTTPTIVAATATSTKPVKNSDDNDEQAVIAAVTSWAQAWSKQDMKNYLAAYVPEFSPGRGLSHKAWEKERRARIEGKQRISVTVGNFKVSFAKEVATVKFRQEYRAKGGMSSDVHKTLVMVKRNGQWKIKQEKVTG